jgi:hypothetical protein
LHQVDLDGVRALTEAQDVLVDVLRFADVVADLLHTEQAGPQPAQ